MFAKVNRFSFSFLFVFLSSLKYLISIRIRIDSIEFKFVLFFTFFSETNTVWCDCSFVPFYLCVFLDVEFIVAVAVDLVFVFFVSEFFFSIDCTLELCLRLQYVLAGSVRPIQFAQFSVFGSLHVCRRTGRRALTLTSVCDWVLKLIDSFTNSNQWE